MMAGVADSPRHSSQPCFQGATQRVGEKDCDIEALALSNQSDRAEERTAGQGDDLIYFRDEFPVPGGFFRGCDRNVGVWTSLLNGAHRRPAEDSVSGLPGPANEDPKRFQIIRRHARSKVDTAPVMREEKIRPRCLPPVVHPEPIF